jgi:predicted transposase YbfD/YdcC
MTTTTPIRSFTECLSALPDYREERKVLYPLSEILLLILTGTLGGAEDFASISLWGRTKLPFLRQFYPYKQGIPSHDTLNDVMNGLDTMSFKTLFSAWVEGLTTDFPEIVALDGKTSRRAHGSGDNDKPLHVVSAWACSQRLVLGQEECAEKSNEITAIPLLLERLALKGALVTIDAMGCQTKIAEKIIECEANYLLALKDNQRSLAREVELYFADKPLKIECFETLDCDHGRIEKRCYTISTDVEWLNGAKNAHNEPKFKNLALIGTVKSEVTLKNTGVITNSTRYFIASLTMKVEDFARAVRAHWAIENNLHWMLDVVFHDDLMRLRTENGAKNMAILKHSALNMIRLHPKKASFKAKHKLAGWDENFLKQIITQTYA